jgi:hypothetical protein
LLKILEEKAAAKQEATEAKARADEAKAREAEEKAKVRWFVVLPHTISYRSF